MAASVVLLPEPVGPVTNTKPRGFSEMVLKMSGAPRSSSVNTSLGIVRNTAAAPRFCTKALTRKRARFGTSKEKSDSRCSSYSLRCLSVIISYTKLCTSLCVSGGILSLRTSPSTRINGGTPAERCKSDALCSTLKANNSVISMTTYTPLCQLL